VRPDLCLAGPAAEPLLAGLLPRTGVLLWALAAGACLLAAAVMPRGPAQRRVRRLLGGVGALTAVLAADGLTGFHEGLAPGVLGIDDEAVLAAYAAAALALLVAYRDLVWRLPLRSALLLAGVAFAVSIGEDVLDLSMPSPAPLALDVAELVAVFNWALYWWVAAFLAVRGAGSAGPDA
jgi:hypothetical protein